MSSATVASDEQHKQQEDDSESDEKKDFKFSALIKTLEQQGNEMGKAYANAVGYVLRVYVEMGVDAFLNQYSYTDVEDLRQFVEHASYKIGNRWWYSDESSAALKFLLDLGYALDDNFGKSFAREWERCGKDFLLTCLQSSACDCVEDFLYGNQPGSYTNDKVDVDSVIVIANWFRNLEVGEE